MIDGRNTYGMPCVGCLIGTAFQRMTSQLDEALRRADLGIKTGEYMILRALYTKDGLQQCEISDMVGKDKSAINRSVGAIERKGLIRTEAVSHKCVRVWLTEKGKELRPRIMKIAAERQQALCSLAPDKDIDSFVKVLKEIIR